MKIKKVYYMNLASEEVADALSSEFGIEKCSYHDCSINPDTLLLGVNINHHLATYLSGLPIVVFDQHTDMYSGVPANNTLRKPEELSNSNWVYWRIKMDSETHLVIPRYRPLPGDLTIPVEGKNRFHIYIVEGSERPVIGNLDCNEPHKLEVLNIEDLRRLKETKKQVSFDFDFLRDIDVEVAASMLRIIANDGDIYDFWLESWQNFEERKNNCVTLFNAINSTN